MAELNPDIVPDEEDFEFLKNCRYPQGGEGADMLARMNESHAPMTTWAFSQLEFGKRVLDVGCGGGNALKMALEARPDGAFVGIDHSMTALEESWEYNKSAIEDKRLILVQTSVSDLPFETDQFDTVYSVESYYFWPNLDADLKELLRVLAPGGQLALIAEMIGGRLGIRDEAIRERLNMTILSGEELVRRLEKAGYEEVTAAQDDEHDWLLVTGRKPVAS